jgi:protein-L-isoaspartate(D-aspartate) O-methyltransferase
MPELNMVNGQVITVGVTDRRVIGSLLTVERRIFLPTALRSVSHIDTDLRLKDASAVSPARYLMPAGPFAQLVQAAEVARTDSVLDIGCATGYASAVLANLADHVIGLECDPELAASARMTLEALNIKNVEIATGPLEAGWSERSPYDVMFIGGSVQRIPHPLVSQLKDGGRLVAIVDDGRSVSAYLYMRNGPTFSGREIFDASAYPLPGFSRPEVFVF